jgi:hypothetical protein
MKKLIYAIILLIYCSSLLFSDFYYLPPLEFSIPEGWTAQETEHMTTFTSPDGEFFIYVWQIKDVFEREKATADITAEIEQVITGFEIKMEEELRINELFVYIADGDGFLGDKDVGVSVAVVEADTYIEIFYYIFLFTGTSEGWNQHWKIVNETIESIMCEREGG